MVAEDRPYPLGEPAPVVGRRVGVVEVHRPVARDQVGTGPVEPGEPPRLHTRTQVERGVHHARRAGVGRAPDRVVEVRPRVRDERQDRHEEHRALEPGVTDRPDRGQPRGRRRRPGLDLLLQFVVVDRDRHRQVDRHRAGRLDQDRQVPTQQGALGEDAERRTRLGEGADDARHQPVPPLGPLVGIGVRAERNPGAGPSSGGGPPGAGRRRRSSSPRSAGRSRRRRRTRGRCASAARSSTRTRGCSRGTG